MPNNEVVELAKPKAPDLDEKEYGVSSSLPTGGWTEYITGPNSEGKVQALSNSPLSIDQLVDMRRKDGQIRALIRLLSLPILAATREAEWVPAEGGEKEAEFANNMFMLPPASGGMTVSKMKFMRQVMLALVEGFACFEEVRMVGEVGPLKGLITVKRMAHRDSRTIRYLVDEKNGTFEGVRQIANVAGRSIDVNIPKDKVWYWAANEEENPFYGVSYFESAYNHYDMKRKLYYISHIASQFAAVPGRVGSVPPQASKKDIDAFRQSLEKFAFNTAMMFPEGFEVDFANQNTGFNFLALIEHQNQMIAKSVLAKFMEDTAKQVLIENASADTSSDFFVMQLEAIMGEIAESLSIYMMPKYIGWNFGTDKFPTFRFGPLHDSTRDVIKDLLQAVAAVQASKWTDEFIREAEKKMADRLGFEVPYDEIEKREEEERARMEEQQKMEQEQMSAFLRARSPQGAPPTQSAATAEAEQVAATAASTGAEIELTNED